MEAIQDLKAIYSTDKEIFLGLCKILATEDKGAEWATNIARLEKKIGEEKFKAILRFINFLSDNLVEARDYHKRLDYIDKMISGVVEDDSEGKSAWIELKENLVHLDKYFEIKKEENIKNRFRRITSFEITTDVRPILSISKDKVKKSLIANILKIQTSDEKTFICEFYEDEIDKIIEELNLTKSKNELLRDHYG